MANRLSRAAIDALWRAYQDRQCVEDVAKKCGVSHRTVERYRRLERWDERLQEARRLAEKEADYDLASAMSESLKMVRVYKSKVAEALDRMTVLDDAVTASELERVVKLEGFILGGVESRHEVVGRFAEWTDEELERFAEHGEHPSRPSRRTA